jgi:hypothetical protein
MAGAGLTATSSFWGLAGMEVVGFAEVVGFGPVVVAVGFFGIEVVPVVPVLAGFSSSLPLRSPSFSRILSNRLIANPFYWC